VSASIRWPTGVWCEDWSGSAIKLQWSTRVHTGDCSRPLLWSNAPCPTGRYMYPNFTGSSGNFPDIDLVTGSDLPYNHIVYLGPTKYDPDVNPPWHPPPNWKPSDWSVVGTVNEATDILLVSPSSSISKAADLASVPSSFSRAIIGLDQDTCPACVKNGESLARVLGGSWRYVPYNATAFIAAVKAKLNTTIDFVAVWFVPTHLNGELKGLNELDGAPWPKSTHNQGKIIIRNDRMYKLTAQARNFLGAAFVGNKNIVEMDAQAQHMSPKEAADAWIKQNPEYLDMFLGEFNVTVPPEHTQ